ncbi:MAG: hypothetical protein V9H26_03495 [Verrucomicrobiota bacterium]
MKLPLIAILSLTGLALTTAAADQTYLHAPSVDTYAKHDPDGLTILSSGRYLKPAGRPIPVAREPYGLAMSRDGKTLFVASDGVGQIITDWRTAKPVVTAVNPPLALAERQKRASDEWRRRGFFAGRTKTLLEQRGLRRGICLRREFAHEHCSDLAEHRDWRTQIRRQLRHGCQSERGRQIPLLLGCDQLPRRGD